MCGENPCKTWYGMVINLLLALLFAVGAWAMALLVSAEVSLSKAQNRLQSGINVGLIPDSVSSLPNGNELTRPKGVL